MTTTSQIWTIHHSNVFYAVWKYFSGNKHVVWFSL